MDTTYLNESDDDVQIVNPENNINNDKSGCANAKLTTSNQIPLDINFKNGILFGANSLSLDDVEESGRLGNKGIKRIHSTNIHEEEDRNPFKKKIDPSQSKIPKNHILNRETTQKYLPKNMPKPTQTQKNFGSKGRPNNSGIPLGFKGRNEAFQDFKNQKKISALGEIISKIPLKEHYLNQVKQNSDIIKSNKEQEVQSHNNSKRESVIDAIKNTNYPPTSPINTKFQNNHNIINKNKNVPSVSPPKKTSLMRTKDGIIPPIKSNKKKMNKPQIGVNELSKSQKESNNNNSISTISNENVECVTDKLYFESEIKSIKISTSNTTSNNILNIDNDLDNDITIYNLQEKLKEKEYLLDKVVVNEEIYLTKSKNEEDDIMIYYIKASIDNKGVTLTIMEGKFNKLTKEVDHNKVIQSLPFEIRPTGIQFRIRFNIKFYFEIKAERDGKYFILKFNDSKGLRQILLGMEDILFKLGYTLEDETKKQYSLEAAELFIKRKDSLHVINDDNSTPKTKSTINKNSISINTRNKNIYLSPTINKSNKQPRLSPIKNKSNNNSFYNLRNQNISINLDCDDKEEVYYEVEKGTLNNLCFMYPFKGINQISLHNSDKKLLNPNNFLNDNIIEFYLRYLFVKLKDNNINLYSKVHSLSSFLYGKLAATPNDPDSGFNMVKKWTRKINFFNSKYIFIPINENFHWYIIIVGALDKFQDYYNFINDKKDIRELNEGPTLINDKEKDQLNSIINEDRVEKEETQIEMKENQNELEPRLSSKLKPHSDIRSLLKLNDKPNLNLIKQDEIIDTNKLEDENYIQFNDERKSSLHSEDLERIASMELLNEGNNNNNNNKNNRINEEMEKELRNSIFTPSENSSPKLDTDKELKPIISEEEIVQINNSTIIKEEEKEKEINKPWIAVLDSLGSSQTGAVKRIRQYIARHAKEQLNLPINKIEPWLFKSPCKPKVPQQPNFYDCGVYLLEYVELFLNDPILFEKAIINSNKEVWDKLTPSKTKRKLILELIDTLSKEYKHFNEANNNNN